MSAVKSAVTTMRSTLDRRREQRRHYRRLAAELATYDTPSAQDDLRAMLARHAPEQVAPIERILDRQAAHRHLAHR